MKIKMLFLLSLLALSFTAHSKTISCSIWNGKSDGAIESPEGHSVNVGVFAGYSDIKIICDEGYNIDAPMLVGFVLGPGFHSQKLLFSCLGQDNLEGTYYGLKADITPGLYIGGGLMVGSNDLCTFGGAGFGLGANIVLGKFTVTQDKSRIVEGHLFNNELAEIASWTYKKCHFIKGILPTDDLGNDDNYVVSETLLIENRCPEEAGVFPKKVKPSQMAKKMNITTEEKAMQYNRAIDALINRAANLGVVLH